MARTLRAMHAASLAAWLGVLCLCLCQPSSQESFEEDMLVRPLPDGNTMTHLSMRTSKPWANPGAKSHYGMFPKVRSTASVCALCKLCAMCYFRCRLGGVGVPCTDDRMRS